ncbi:MAG: PKD domain-containing protein, partial [Gemmatimonadota bacterium]
QWSWGFGDGATSTEQNPVHAYTSGGTYQVSLTVTDDDGATGQFARQVMPNEKPFADFSFSCTGRVCQFTDLSSDPDGSISSRAWNFGDGGTSSQVNPSHTYAADGDYTVVLIATDNQAAEDTASKLVGVQRANELPAAAFSSTCTNLSCDFTDESTDADGTIVEWQWTFGDGQTSTAQSPSHVYASAGTFTVTLTVTDNDGGVSNPPASRQITVSPANQGPTADFTFTCVNLVCQFTDGSSDPDGTIVSRSWNFGDGNGSTQANPQHAFATKGTYQVTLEVTDDAAATGQVSKPVTVNTTPSATIVQPSNGSSFSKGASVQFQGTANDGDGDDLVLVWESSEDGFLSATSTFTKSDLSIGLHVISFIANDGTDADTARVTISIINQAPLAAISAPTGGSVFELGESVGFSGTGTDPEDGALGGASLVWLSSLDGEFGTGTSFSWANLSSGNHLIRLVATDSDGAADTASVSIRINAPPTATITAPADGSSFTESTNVSFRGTGIDPEDGALSGSELVWTSDIQPGGQFGTGSPTNENGLIVGTHVITLTVTDSDGATGTDQISVTITPPANQAPTASITAPSQDTTATQGDVVAFAGTGSDPEDGTLTGASLQWESSLDGGIDSGVSFSISNLTLGVHTIRLIATDGDAASDTATVTVTIETPPNDAPTANFSSSCTNLVCDFTDTSTDPDGTITGWSWDFGDGNGSTAQNPQHTYGVGGPYTVTLVASDNQAASDTVAKGVSLSSPILPGYQIEVRESPGVTLTASQRAAVDAAAARWESLITGDLLNIAWAAAAGTCGGATVPALNETVDDLVIYLEFVPIDGPGGILGSAGPCLIRGAGNLPFLGGMKFDTADLANLESQGRLEAVIVHEMGHVLGIGTLWSLFGLLNDPTSPSPAPINDTWFSGAAAIAAFNSIGGAGYGAGEIVPVENDNTVYGSGSLNGHWRESVFSTELMTPSIGVGSSPLSVVTSESLVDLGYTVNSAVADPFTLSFALLDTDQQPYLLLMDDIWLGPIEIVDTQGRVTGSFRAF